jgi:hypothetical protein
MKGSLLRSQGQAQKAHMICTKQRVARARHSLTFALLVLASANLAQSATAPDISFSPAALA